MDFKFGYSWLIILGACLWGTIGLFSRPLTSLGLGAVESTLTRYIITVVIMFFVILIVDRKLFKIELRDIWMFIGTGFCSLMITNTCYLIAQQELTLSLAAVLLYTAPCFVMLFSVIFLKEKLTRQKVYALILAFVGCILCSGIIGAATNFNTYGLMMGMASGVAFSLYTIFGKIATRKYSAYTIAFYTFVVAGLSITPLCNLGTIPAVCEMHPDAIMYILLMGILSTAAPYFLYNMGLKGIEAGKASVLAFAEPLTMTIIGIIFFQEYLTVFSAIGLIMMFVSIVLLSINLSVLRYESIHKRKLG